MLRVAGTNRGCTPIYNGVLCGDICEALISFDIPVAFHNEFLKQGFPPIKLIRGLMIGDNTPVL